MNKEDLIKYCCGCGLCNDSVPGAYTSQGYYRPQNTEFNDEFDSTVCYCNQIVKPHDSLWGNIINCYYGYSNNPDIRRMASSGGAITSIACYLLDSGEVDEIIQIGVSKEDCLKTEVRHSTTVEEVMECCGSRYTSSSLLLNFLQTIKKDKRYAVIGKPCDIRVLRAYLDLHEEVNRSIFVLLTFFCGGTPSVQANDNLMDRMGLKREELVSFRYRGDGWPGKAKGTSNKGETIEIDYEESWGKYLGRDLQEVCRFCWEGVGEAADISCGDGWYLDNDRPSFEEREGRNVIIARTEKVDNILKKMDEKQRISLTEIDDIGVLNQMQPGQLMRKSAMFSRVLAMKVMGKTVPDYSLKDLIRYSKYISLKLNIEMFGGTIKRIRNGSIR